MKPSEARVKNVLRAGTRKAEAMMPSCVRSEPAGGVGRRRGYNSDSCLLFLRRQNRDRQHLTGRLLDGVEHNGMPEEKE